VEYVVAFSPNYLPQKSIGMSNQPNLITKCLAEIPLVKLRESTDQPRIEM
jgi:hypothetical protein